MISTEFLQSLIDSFPNGMITKPVLGASYVTDRKGRVIGHIDYQTEKLFIDREYKYAKQVKEVLVKNDVEYQERTYRDDEIEKFDMGKDIEPGASFYLRPPKESETLEHNRK